MPAAVQFGSHHIIVTTRRGRGLPGGTSLLLVPETHTAAFKDFCEAQLMPQAKLSKPLISIDEGVGVFPLIRVISLERAARMPETLPKGVNPGRREGGYRGLEPPKGHSAHIRMSK